MIGNKKERPGSEVLTLLLKSLESIVKSEVFPVLKTLVSIRPICAGILKPYSEIEFYIEGTTTDQDLGKYFISSIYQPFGPVVNAVLLTK